MCFCSLSFFPSILIKNVFLNPALPPFFSSFGNSESSKISTVTYKRRGSKPNTCSLGPISVTPAGGQAWLRTRGSNFPSLLLCRWAPGWRHPQKLQSPLDFTTRYHFSSFIFLISFSCLHRFTLTAGSAPLGWVSPQAKLCSSCWPYWGSFRLLSLLT